MKYADISIYFIIFLDINGLNRFKEEDNSDTEEGNHNSKLVSAKTLLLLFSTVHLTWNFIVFFVILTTNSNQALSLWIPGIFILTGKQTPKYLGVVGFL